MSELVLRLINGISSDHEGVTLQQLNTYLVSPPVDGGTPDPDNQFDVTTLDNCEHGTPYPKVTPEEICTTQENLNKFTCYLFDRRFGWSETDTEDGRRVRRMSCSGATMSAGNEKQKAFLNTLLDHLIKWYMHQELSLSVLQALKYTIKQCANLPVVRNRAVIHTMEWCKNNTDQLCDSGLFTVIQDVIVLSMTDVWSAIRNACASRLSSISHSLSLQQVHTLFDSFVKVCSNDSLWQSKEGAIMGINAILQKFLNHSGSKSPLSSPRTLDDEIEKNVPEFISDSLRSVVFSLLSHSQLTIREHAAKTLATYITCSSVTEALATLHEVVLILKKGTSGTDTHTNNTQVFHGKFLDDYASEGFLCVCIFLVKVIPLNCLLPGWPEYISTFLLYISHPASTVRQAASSVFKYLVVKSSHSVVVLKLILQSLAMGWNPDTDTMTLETPQGSNDVGQPLPSVCHYTGHNLADTWEGREGRMFAYELIFKYLIKNHWLYTFGPAGSGLQIDVNASKDAPASEIDVKMNNNVQANTSNLGMHHVESEKSLAVRFLTQADITEVIESPTANHLDRGMTVDQDSDPSPRGQGHSPKSHKSWCRTGISQGVGLSYYDNVYSLLTQAQLVDNHADDTLEGQQTSTVKQELQLNKLRKLLDNNNTKNSSAGCKCGWMEKEHLPDMSRILKVILYQTAESLGHSQWELRRIANQVLPCLAEVIRWYDINLLVSIWNSYLNAPVPTCLMTFTSVLTLKESVVHAVRLVPLLHKPPQSWQDFDHCHECISSITCTVQRRVLAYLPHLQQLIQRTCHDKLSILAADVILVSYKHLAIPTEQKASHYQSVLQFWLKTFYHAHPQSRISTDILQFKSSQFTSPFEGYLSCCLVKPDNKIQCAKQVDKQLVSDCYHHISSFLESLPVYDTVTMVTILSHYIGQFVEDSHICKHLIDSLQYSVAGVVSYTLEETEGESKQNCLKAIFVSLKELSALIAMKSLDLPQLQKILVIYEELCKPVNLGRHLTILMSAISARLNETVEFSVDTVANTGLDGDLYLMSNDIPCSYSPDIGDDSDSEEVIVGTPSSNRFIESLTLNTSNNSGSLTGRVGVALSEGGDISSTPREAGSDSEGEESESSDWDSWDDEDEGGQSAFSEVFSDFLGRIQKSSGAEFMTEVKLLREKEKSVIMGLLKS